jgi:hypothetical protein
LRKRGNCGNSRISGNYGNCGKCGNLKKGWRDGEKGGGGKEAGGKKGGTRIGGDGEICLYPIEVHRVQVTFRGMNFAAQVEPAESQYVEENGRR